MKKKQTPRRDVGEEFGFYVQSMTTSQRLKAGLKY